MEVPLIEGKILTDSGSLKKYSSDKSPYVVRPSLIALPKNENDVQELVSYAQKKRIPITSRGAGSNLCGSSLGKGMIIDFSSRHSILSRQGNTVRIEPGIVYDTLNTQMKKHKLWLAFSPSSGSYCSVGGNVATKASGLRSVKYGTIDRYIKSIRYVNDKGTVIDTSKPLPQALTKKILALRDALKKDKKALKALQEKKHLKTSSGYTIQALLSYRKPADIVTHLFVGSVGTLGILTEIELELIKKPQKTLTCFAYFSSLHDAGKTVNALLKTHPSALEIMDEPSLNLIRRSASIPDESKAALLIEYDEKLPFSETKAKQILSRYATSYEIKKRPAEQQKLWKLRKDMLESSKHIKSQGKALTFIEDVGVPVKHLASFISDVQRLLEKYQSTAIIYGHAGDGNLHIRPLIAKNAWKKTVESIASECFSLVFKYGGTIAGEHGSGRNKSPYLQKEWGPVYKYFRKVKSIFDPKGLFNPGVILSNEKITKHMVY